MTNGHKRASCADQRERAVWFTGPLPQTRSSNRCTSGSSSKMSDAMTSEHTARVRLRVTEADTASTMRSGDVPVLATPRVIALCEEAACAAVAGALEPGTTSVGTWIELEHLAASSVGAGVVAEATLKRLGPGARRTRPPAGTPHSYDCGVQRGREVRNCMNAWFRRVESCAVVQVRSSGWGTATAAARSMPGWRQSAASISPSSTRNPRVLIIPSRRP